MIASAGIDLELQPTRSVERATEPVAVSPVCYPHTPPSLQQLSLLQTEALNALAFPMFAVLGDGSLVFANHSGRTALRAEQWVRQLSPGRLAAGRHVYDSRTLTSALTALRVGRSTTALLTDGATERQAVLGVAPVTAASLARRMSAAGLIWLIPATAASVPIGQLARVFELTRAEERLLQQLVTGAELREVAEKLGISVHTARNQLKSIFRKTGRGTQGQLLALANRMAAVRCRECLGSNP